MGLYLLIWGEAANVRFMPECLCYIFHNVSFLHALQDSWSMLKKLHWHASGWSDIDRFSNCLLLAFYGMMFRWHMNSMDSWREMSALLLEKTSSLLMVGMMNLSCGKLLHPFTEWSKRYSFDQRNAYVCFSNITKRCLLYSGSQKRKKREGTPLSLVQLWWFKRVLLVNR